MFRYASAVAAVVALATAFSPQVNADTNSPRVSAMYTTWDSYYFYAGFEVNDSAVFSTNTTPVSQPQQDDDVEVFFETDNARADHRTPHTYQMAVSAGNGAYFSVGDNSNVPKAKVVYTYKYAATVDGALNDPSTPARGYTIELAIPWQELGLGGPPDPGTEWGFNVISRDRASTATPATKLYSLSDKVQSEADVQNPSKWTKIVFSSTGRTSDASVVYSPEVTTRFPLINGSIVSGEWPSISRVTFGYKGVDAPAPTIAEEPNTTDSPFAVQPPAETPPAPAPVQAPVVATNQPPAPTTPTSIALPGGGSIQLVPGGIKNPAGLNPPVQASTTTSANQNPLAPKFQSGYEPPPNGVMLTGSLNLGAPVKPNLVMALYRIDLNGDPRKPGGQNVWDPHGRTLLVDQPMEGTGPWFSGLSTTWHRQQLLDMRHAGIDVALIHPVDGDKRVAEEVDALVAALKDLKASGDDYPLVGVDATGNSSAHIKIILDRVPDEFRAKWPIGDDGKLGALVYGGDGASEDLADGVPTSTMSTSDVAVVCPGGYDTQGALTGRKAGDTYDASWSAAASAQCVLVDSWNDYSRGTEVCESRQYGEHYVDQTKIHSIAYNGSKQWHAKYLAYSVTRTYKPRTIYTVSLRIENAGTLPWRAGEGYSLCARWYHDGRLFDDSAPRIPLSHDVLPGQSATVNLGVVAMNGYGDDLDPGDYVLVFDMVQGADKWFSYASDLPLQMPVTILGADTASASPSVKTASDTTGQGTETDTRIASFLNASTPPTIDEGGTASTAVTLRNDGSAAWPAGDKLSYKLIEYVKGDDQVLATGDAPLSTGDVQPGDVVTVPTKVSAQGLDAGEYRLHWFVSGSADVAGSYDEGVEVIPAGVHPAFVLSDIPRSVSAGKDFLCKLAVRNLGTTPWTKSQLHVDYHWYYLDGREASWDGGISTPIDIPVGVGQVDAELNAKAHAPDLPGRYILVWDARTADGSWTSTAAGLTPDETLPVIIDVTGKTPVVPVDLSKYAASADAPFDAGQLPRGMLPPDGAGEVDVNPLLLGKPGPPLYPSGYYAGASGDGWLSNHAVPFLYAGNPAAGIACNGQHIDLPPGPCREVHLLAAAGGTDPVTASFAVGGASTDLAVASWKTAPPQPAWWSPYSETSTGDVDPSPCYLGDYVLHPSGSNAGTLTLPNAPSIKVLAVTVVR